MNRPNAKPSGSVCFVLGPRNLGFFGDGSEVGACRSARPVPTKSSFRFRRSPDAGVFAGTGGGGGSSARGVRTLPAWLTLALLPLVELFPRVPAHVDGLAAPVVLFKSDHCRPPASFRPSGFSLRFLPVAELSVLITSGAAASAAASMVLFFSDGSGVLCLRGAGLLTDGLFGPWRHAFGVKMEGGFLLLDALMLRCVSLLPNRWGRRQI